jgi:hypothetical protein
MDPVLNTPGMMRTVPFATALSPLTVARGGVGEEDPGK